MASNPILDPRVADAVRAAMSQLVRTQSWVDSVYVSMPMFYPNGTQIAIKIEPSQNKFRVSDGGRTYRELEQIGAERFFPRRATIAAEEIEGFIHNRAICADVEENELASMIAEIADVVSLMSSKIMSRLAGKHEEEIADHLYERLKIVFGEPRVERGAKIGGPSTKSWEVDAVVHLDERDAVFHAVSNHYASVYSTSAMFHDLALKDRPPALTSVVHNKDDLGFYHNILAQAGNVIEEEQADAVYKGAVQWVI